MNKKIFSLLLISIIFLSLIINLNLISASSNSSCTEDWDCTSWDSCRYGERERDCVDLNNCGTTNNKPTEIRYCNDYYYYGYPFCDPDNYYGKSHPCYDLIRDKNYYHNYYGNYYDDYQYEVFKYYEDKYNPDQNEEKDNIQIIQLSYPQDERNEEKNDNLTYQIQKSDLPFIILISILAILSLIAFLAIMVIILRRR